MLAYARNKTWCHFLSGGNGVDEYFIKITAPEENCLNCVKPVRGPDIRLDTEKLKDLNITVTIQAGKPVDATQAA